MKRLSMILSWQKVVIIGLAVFAGGTVTAYEMKAANDAADARRQTTSTEDRSDGSQSPVNDSTVERRQNSRDPQAAKLNGFAECYATLQKAQKTLSRMSGYSAIFTLRERVAGKLTDKQQIGLRIRHKPFSVYMKWADKGREAVFVEGKNNNKLVVKPGGLAALIGTLELDPKGETAMEEARYPITEAGMLTLIEKVIAYQKPLLKDQNGVACVQSINRCAGEDCNCFVVTHDAPSICDGYAKTTLHFGRKTGLLVSIENHCFDKSSKSGMSLVEHYVFTDVKPDVGFSDGDFQLAQSGITGRLLTATTRRASTRQVGGLTSSKRPAPTHQDWRNQTMQNFRMGFNVAAMVALFALAGSLPGCTESQAERNDTEAEARARDDGGIDIQAPGVDVKINTDGVTLGVDTDGDGNTRSK